MILIIKNQTAGTLSYLGGTVTVAGNSNTTVPAVSVYPISRDPGLTNDSLIGTVLLNDGVVDYTTNNAVSYLSEISAQKIQITDTSGIIAGPMVISAGNNLPISLGATNYVLSTVNTSVVQLASNATFTGGIETTFNQQSYSVLLTCDQPCTVTLNQFIDAAGTFLAQTTTYSMVANQNFAKSNVVNGNYFNIVIKNTGISTTTTLNLNTAYGTIPSATQLNNQPISINEVNGIAVTPQSDGSLPVRIIDKSGSGTIIASNGTLVANTNGCSNILFNITGTWVATLIFEAQSGDNNWFTILGSVPGQDNVANSLTVNAPIIIPCGSCTQVRVRASAYTSGTVGISYNASSGSAVHQIFNLNAAALNAQIVGNVASLTSDSGNPIKVGSVYTSAGIAPTTGQRADLQSNQFGELNINFRNKFRNLTGNATTTVKSGSGTLSGVLINNNTTGGTITIYDNTAASGTLIGTFTVGSPSGGLLSSSGQPSPFSTGPLGLEFATGLTIVTAGSASNNVTILYR